MTKKQKKTAALFYAIVLVVLLAGIFLTRKPAGGEHESIKAVMRDAVLHDVNKVNFLGIMEVNPAVVSAYTVTGIILLFALIIRIFVIPKFTNVPGKFQLLLESWVGLFDGLAKKNSPHKSYFIGSYIFAAGSYIFIGTVFELFGLQTVTTDGRSIAMPAPLADINGAICMGVMSYLVILSGGIAVNKLKGMGQTLKDFSLPVSMSFRLFGALLSGALVTELVYYFMFLSFVLPVVVGVLFTLIHAVIQSYVLTMLASVYFGEVTEHHEKKPKEKKQKKKPDGGKDK